MANPFTTMRHNVEAALEAYAGLSGVVLRKWDDERKQRVDNPAADREKWIRVETISIVDDPFYANSHAKTTHRMQIVFALPEGRGLKQEDIEELYYQIALALRPLSRDQNMDEAIEGLQKFEFTGGDVNLSQDDQPKRKATTDGLAWFMAGTIEAVYEESI
jgi:hypothetical protein